MILSQYSKIIVAFSGGKDSLACLLFLLENDCQQKIELWHHDVDGESTSPLFDWACTRSYCEAIAKAFNVPIYFSWKEGGLEAEMNRLNQPTKPVYYQTPDGIKSSGGKSNRLNTRRKFPQTSPDLSVRWCSSYGKIMVMSSAICGQDRFKDGSKILVVTGERREESANRSRYAELQYHSTNCKSRHVDHWRPIIDWSEKQVWDIIEKHKVAPHPAYKLGWGRTSCLMCIFASDNQLASANVIAPQQVQKIAEYEFKFGSLHSGVLRFLFELGACRCLCLSEYNVAFAFFMMRSHTFMKTIHRKYSVRERILRGDSFPMNSEDIRQATSTLYYSPIIVDDWVMPLGATMGDRAGPS